MKHCQYCNSTRGIAETRIQVIPDEHKPVTGPGPVQDVTVYTCEPCFEKQVWVDHDVIFSVDGERVQA